MYKICTNVSKGSSIITKTLSPVLLNVPVRTHFVPRSVKLRWKYKRPKPTKIPEQYLDVNKPISGSAPFAEELEELRQAKLFDFDVKSLSARGFLRFQNNYDPPSDVVERFLSLCRSTIPKGTEMSEKELSNFNLVDSKLKYDVLTAAFKEFNHSIPNSMLYLMKTTGDALKFYNTRVETTTPYEALQRLPDLPPNIHIQKEPVRFHPDTDTKFNGISAFPQSSTIVTGLRAKKKFPGYKADHRGYNYKI